MSGGGSMGKSSSNSRQQSTQSAASEGFSKSFVDPAQQAFLDMMRQAAAGVYGESQGVGNEMLSASRGLFSQGQQLLGQLTGATGGVIDQMGEDVNRQLQRQLGGAGGVNSQAAMAGALGGGRNQVERGLAQQGALDTFGQQAANLRLGGTQSALSALPGLFNLGMGGLSAQWAPLQALSSILGDPTVLQQAQDWSKSQGQSSGQAKSNEWKIGVL